MAHISGPTSVAAGCGFDSLPQLGHFVCEVEERGLDEIVDHRLFPGVL